MTDERVLEQTPEQEREKLWAPRDASFYRYPSQNGVPRWHLVGADGITSLCQRIPILNMDMAHEEAPNASMRCVWCLRKDAKSSGHP